MVSSNASLLLPFSCLKRESLSMTCIDNALTFGHFDSRYESCVALYPLYFILRYYPFLCFLSFIGCITSCFVLSSFLYQSLVNIHSHLVFILFLMLLLLLPLLPYFVSFYFCSSLHLFLFVLLPSPLSLQVSLRFSLFCSEEERVACKRFVSC